jgi:hypothetical protein
MLRYYVAMTRDNKIATAWGTTREGALAAARAQRSDVEIIGSAYRWRWAVRLLAWGIRRFRLHDEYRQVCYKNEK